MRSEDIISKLFDDIIAANAKWYRKQNKKISIWEQQPVDIETFVCDERYLNLKDEINPCILNDLKMIFDGWHKFRNPKYKIVINYSSIGTGKSYLSSIIAVYILYQILCIRDPHKFFGLSRGAKIAITNHSINEKNARRVVFGEIGSKIYYSDWFSKNYPPDPNVKSELRFDTTPEDPEKRIESKIYKNVYILPGSSTWKGAVGYNVICGIIDEATLYIDEDGTDKAELLYKALFRRVSSRYWDNNKPGMIVICGSPSNTDTFVEKLIAETKNDKDVLLIRRNRWEFRHPKWTGKIFYFNHKSLEVIEDEKRGEKLLAENPNNIIKVPYIYIREAKQDPLQFKREAAGIATDTVEPFFNKNIILDRINYNRQDPINNLTFELSQDYSPIKDILYSIHVDIGLKKDACGIAMSHFGGYTEDNEVKVVVDFVLRLEARDFSDGEVSLPWVRNFIESLQFVRGFNLGLVTFDGYQSITLIQELNQKGIRSEVLSVDRTTIPYRNLKDLIYYGRIDFYNHPVLIDELCHLEEIKGKKIDHPRKGCLSGDTIVMTGNGNKQLESLCGSDFSVISQDLVGFLYSLIEARSTCYYMGEKRYIEITLENGDKIKSTPDHLFYLNKHLWIEARKLTPGAKLWKSNIRVKEVSKISENKIPMYDINVPILNNFMLKNGIIVHNSKDCSDALAGSVYNIIRYPEIFHGQNKNRDIEAIIL